jgi:hypothetical protein
MIEHKIIRNKMKKNSALLEHPLISEHIPETVWYNAQNLKEMLARYKVIYIKPNAGKQGNRIIRARMVDKSNVILSYNNSSKNILLSDISNELEAIMAKRRYIIQEGIDLATYRDCPFDIRMVMQKPYTTWELTLTSAKVALREDAVVTNVSKGAQDYPLNYILQQYDQKQDPLATLRELVNFAHQVSNILGSQLPLRIIGLDLAVDKKGKVWFIEANTQPQCRRCQLVNDKISLQKYKKAKRIIKKKGYY